MAYHRSDNDPQPAQVFGWLFFVLFVLLGVAVLTVGCGAPVEPASETDLGRVEQELIKENWYGVRNDANRGPCSPGTGIVCHYPLDYEIRVCIPSTHGFSPPQAFDVQDALFWADWALNSAEYVISSEWDIVYSCTNPDITIRNGSFLPSGGTPAGQGLGAYMTLACTSESGNLIEQPAPFNGTHRHCYHWSAFIDAADIDATWGDNALHVYRHAVGAIASIAAGVGLRTAGDPTSYTYRNVTPLGKFGWDEDETCRMVRSWLNNSNGIAVESGGNFCDNP